MANVADSQTTNCNTSCKLQRLLPQKEYLIDLCSRKCQPLVLQESDSSCGICLDTVTELISEHEGQAKIRTKVIVALRPCQHIFHYSCIVRWHTSIRPERNTCPICRCELFVADPLTDAQIDLLTNGVRLPRREETIARLRPDEVLVPWDMFIMLANAQQSVDGVIEHVRASRIYRRLWGHPWIALCKRLRDEMLLICGQLRPVFQPHGDTFILAIVAAVLLVQITRHPSATRRPDFQRLVDLTDELVNGFREEEFRTLYNQFLYGGLFEIDSYYTIRATREHIRAQIAITARIRLISAEMRDRQQESKHKGFFRRVAHFNVSDLLEDHPRRSDKTLSAVLSRMTNGETPHFLAYVRRSSAGDHAPDLEWNDVLALENHFS